MVLAFCIVGKPQMKRRWHSTYSIRFVALSRFIVRSERISEMRAGNSQRFRLDVGVVVQALPYSETTFHAVQLPDGVRLHRAGRELPSKIIYIRTMRWMISLRRVFQSLTEPARLRKRSYREPADIGRDEQPIQRSENVCRATQHGALEAGSRSIC